MPAFEQFAEPDGYPSSTDLHDKLLCVPLYADLAMADVDLICDVIIKALDA